MVKVTFLPFCKVVEVPKGSTISEAAVAAGVQIQSTCGGRGTCGKCKVQIPVESLDLSKKDDLISETEWAEGWVLACKQTIEQDLTVQVDVQYDAFDRKLALDSVKDITIAPSICKYYLELEKPSVKDQTSDWERLTHALPSEKIRFNRRLALNLAETLRDARFKVTAVVDNNSLLAIEKGDTVNRSFGLAIDIGTTTVVVYLMDLNTGEVIDRGAVTNPQQMFGADVISRITHASDEPEGLQQLQSKVMEALNEIINRLCKTSRVNQQEIYQTVVVGNTTMGHLFLGLDPTYLATTPFIPVFQHSVEVEAREIGLNILDMGKVIVLPNIAGYVGSDTVSAMLAAKIADLSGFSLLIDIGTNGEIALAGNDQILTCSAAAGPAFEGAEIECGMRAAEGAIEKVLITDSLELGVIPGSKPKGICGSGLIDVIAEMRKVGIINASGRFASKEEELAKLSPAIRKRVIEDDEGDCKFILVWGKDSVNGEDIIVSQQDIRKLQLAKGAIMAGVQILLKEMDINIEEIDRVLLAGAFGNYIKKESAVGINLLPPIELDRIKTIGNAAGDGAKIALLSKEERYHAEILASRTKHIELSTRSDFQAIFMKALGL